MLTKQALSDGWRYGVWISDDWYRTMEGDVWKSKTKPFASNQVKLLKESVSGIRPYVVHIPPFVR